MDETLAMETALLAAMSMVNPTETLLVLTADHSHVMTMGGQATPRGQPVLGRYKLLLLQFITIIYNAHPSASMFGNLEFIYAITTYSISYHF